MKRGQTTLEYILLIGVFAAALIAMLVYVGRGHQGNLRSHAEQLGAGQYAPGNTKINNGASKKIVSTARAGSSTTVNHGNLNDPHQTYVDKRKKVDTRVTRLYGDAQNYEDMVISEATQQAKIESSCNEDSGCLVGWTAPATGAVSYWLDYESTFNELYGSGGLVDQLDKISNDIKNTTQTPDGTSGGSSSNEEGTIKTQNNIDETLGDL
jgi:Flp pilus assembly pilin Flp